MKMRKLFAVAICTLVAGSMISGGCSSKTKNRDILPVSGAGLVRGGSVTEFETSLGSNDKFEDAIPFTIGQPAVGDLFTIGDVDYWKFTATAGQLVRLDLHASRFDHEYYSWIRGRYA